MIDPQRAKRDALVGNICFRLLQTLPASDVWIALVDPAGPLVRYHYSDAGLQLTAQPLEDALALDVLASNDFRASLDAGYAPLRDDDALVGVVWLTVRDGPIDDDVMPILAAFADHLSLALQTAILHDRAVVLEELAIVDALTGVPNRRAFDLSLEREFRRAARAGRAITVALLDIDHFKLYNDRYGHPAGDACLQRIARECSADLVRASDHFSRYGGEEFALVLPDADIRSGGAIAERIRKTIADLAIPNADCDRGFVTASIGVAAVIPTPEVRPQDLVACADRALYRAKATGRNRTVADELTDARVDEITERTPLPAPNNLPAPLSTFVGRDADLARVGDLLAHYRLVTLVGPGGVGKTRIAIQAALDTGPRCEDGTWMVELSPLRDERHVVPKLAGLFGIEETSDRDLLGAIVARVRNKRLLLVLDNCEHVLGAVARLAHTILQECPHVLVLATSRERLAIAGEATYRVPPLALPPPDLRITAATAMEFPAVRLFVVRAQLVNNLFALTDENARTVVDICRRLDGIALAIELSAARLRSFDIDRIAALLSQRFRLLTNGDRSALPHQQTLHATIDWSYQLLSGAEAALFERLSVFAGGFSLEAILAVCIDGALDEAQVFGALSALVDKSLVHFDASRYRLLESTREYARERCAASGELPTIAAAHAAYVRAFVERSSLAEGAGAYRAWLEPLQADLDNLRAALTWAIGDGGDIACGAAIAAALVETSSLGQWTEWATWNRRALEALDGLGAAAPAAVRGRLLTRRAEFASHYGAFGGTTTAVSAADQAVTLLRDAPERKWLLEALNAHASALLAAGRRDDALRVAREGLSVARAAHDRVYQASFSRRIGTLLDRQSATEALLALEESITLCRELENDFGLALLYHARSHVYATTGRLGDAIADARMACTVRRDMGDVRGLSYALCDLSTFVLLQTHADDVVPFLREAMNIAHATENDLGRAMVAQTVALLAARSGARRDAARLSGYADARYHALGTSPEHSADLRREALARALRGTPGEPLSELRAEGERFSRAEVDAAMGIVLAECAGPIATIA